MSSSGPAAATLDRVVAALLTTAAGVTLGVTVWIAVRTPDAAVRLLRDPLAIGQVHALLTGLVAAHLMLVQVALLARLPWLERSWGRAVLVRRHRLLALWSTWLALAHVALFALQRATRSPDDVLGAWWALFVTDRQMLWASLGTLALLVVMVSSLAVVRRRLRYETWHLLHVWSYAGMALVVPHILVSVDFGDTWATTYWWTLYAVVLALLLVFRIAAPLAVSWRHRLRVADVRPEAGGAVSIVVSGRHLTRMRARPGQFLVWRFLGGRGWSRGHPYSLSAAPSDTMLRITVGGSGDGAVRLAGLRPGAPVLVEGPYGVPLASRRRHPRLLMLAAGVGVTPFRTYVEGVPPTAGEATLVVRVHDEASFVLGEELRRLCTERGVELVVLAGPRRSPSSWLPEGVDGGPAAVLRGLVPDLEARDLMLCGPPGWTEAVRVAAVRAGVAQRDLHTEQFSW